MCCHGKFRFPVKAILPKLMFFQPDPFNFLFLLFWLCLTRPRQQIYPVKLKYKILLVRAKRSSEKFQVLFAFCYYIDKKPPIYTLDAFHSFLWGVVSEDSPNADVSFPVSMFVLGFVFQCF